MDNQDRVNEQQDREENVLFGIVGAFLFALAGGILYYVLYQIGYLAGISGLIGVICAIKGYSFFAKKESVRGIIIAIIMAVIVLVIAWYFVCQTTCTWHIRSGTLTARWIICLHSSSV